MKYLLIVPQLGFTLSDKLVPGGLLNFGRSVARVLGSSPDIQKLTVWCVGDPPGTEPLVEKMVRIYAHPDLALEVRCFGGSKAGTSTAVAWASLWRQYDHIMYLLVNQAVLSAIPWHLPYIVWEVGRELFQPVSRWQYHALTRANRLLSISRSTSDMAIKYNPGLPAAQVVHLCVEPPLFEPDLQVDPITQEPNDPARHKPAVFILANMHREYLYKGHLELIAGWPEVVRACPDAELWIGGTGSGKAELEAQARALPGDVAKQIVFLGWLDDAAVHRCFQECRVFAMPSRGEGFGLVFVEAARYGLPCIAGKHDGAKEIVLHNQTGLLVEQDPHEVAAACIQLLADDDLAKRLGEAGRKRYLNMFRFPHFRERLLHTLDLRL